MKDKQSIVVAPGGAGTEGAPASAEAIVAEWERTLVHVAMVAGVENPTDDVRQAAIVALRDHQEPLEQMCAAGAKLGLRVSVARASLADALWTASGLTPLVLFSDVERRWLVVRKAGPFRAVVSSVETQSEPETISRRVLARRLGLRSVRESVDFGVVQSSHFSPEAIGHPDDHHGHDDAPGPIARFLAVLKPETPEVIAITSFSLVTALLYLALPLAVSAFVTNIAFGNQSAPFIQALLFIGIAMSGALLLSALIRGLQLYTTEVVKRRLFVRLVADLSERLPRVDMNALEGVSATELMNRFLDIVTLQSATERVLLYGIPVVVGVVVGTIVLGLYHPTLAMFSIALTIGLAITLLSGRGAVDAAIRESRLKYETIAWLEELARVPTLFKGPGGASFALQRSEHIARSYLVARKRFFMIWLRQVGVLLLLEIFATAALLLVGGWLVLRQQLTLGQLVASELIVASITYSISKLGALIDSYYGGLAAMDKISHLTDLPTERVDGDIARPDAAGMRVECRDIGFSYPSGGPLLQGFNLDIAPGECVGLWGISGRGTSTALKLLFGLHAPQAGYVRLDGLDLRNWDLERLRARICLLRAGDIVTGTIMENLRLGREDLDAGTLATALDRAGLLQDVLAMADGMNTRLLAGGLPLSSRQRLRLLVARALVHRPSLLLVDDVLDGMEDDTLQDVLRVLTAPDNAWTVVVATRDLAVAQSCDRHVEVDGAGGARVSAQRWVRGARL
jgi:ABC-type bacteriocin/lantibiotic exporter with double-glycine peptidase domain